MSPQTDQAILLVNLGSPDKAKVPSVYVYLTQFLNDPKVIDIPLLARLLLVNLIIIPVRVFGSTKAYQKLWTDKGSPLIYYTRKQAELIQHKMGEDAQVYWAMRYRKPSIASVMKTIKANGHKKLLIVPMFPQFADATNGSVMAECERLLHSSDHGMEIEYIEDFFDDPGYIQALATQGRKFDFSEYDHILMSYHGLPLRHLEKVHGERSCEAPCTIAQCQQFRKCYQGQCYSTSRALAKELGLKEDQYTVCFQSRLDKKWTKPFADKEIKRWAEKGAKKLLVFSPAFVADCLETIVEIGDEYQEEFEEMGGEKIQLVPGLNDSEDWISAMERLLRAKLTSQTIEAAAH
ncbi:MAG: ferrochelatase [Flavobacteriales bacterium]|nr:ferrochelatase [Flavobacteriales bacterium]